MTVFKPEKKTYTFLIISLLVAGILVSAFTWVYFYNLRVTLGHLTTNSEKDLKTVRVQNAEAKNILYALINPADVGNLVAEWALVRDNNPTFVHREVANLGSENL